MNVELLNTEVDVNCTFLKEGRVLIHRIRHGATVYSVSQVTCNWQVREGQEIIDKFTVKTAAGDTLWLSWARTRRSWSLEEIHTV